MAGLVINELKGWGNKLPRPALKYYPFIGLKGLKKPINDLRVAGLLAKISMWNPLNTKQQWVPFSHV
jgi:hypothetical protein